VRSVKSYSNKACGKLRMLLTGSVSISQFAVDNLTSLDLTLILTNTLDITP
jgi:hypothetical protein